MKLSFITDKHDAHVERFEASFQKIPGVTFSLITIDHTANGPTGVLEGRSLTGWDALRSAVGETTDLVVSGPLDTITPHLVGGDYRHIGISWATDVMVSAAKSLEDLRALTATVVGLDLVVTDNYATENALIALGVDPEAICRIPWGPEESETGATISRADLGVSPEAFLVLYPRSLEPHYQPEVFIEALAVVVKSHPSVVAMVVESGSKVAAITADIATRGLGDHVVWQALVPPQQFPALIACADGVVVTPQTDGTSVTVMDAMRQGVPVISTLTNGSGEWVIDGITGWSFPVGNAAALATAVMRLMDSSPAERAQVVANAQHLVSKKAGWARSEAALLEEIQIRFIS